MSVQPLGVVPRGAPYPEFVQPGQVGKTKNTEEEITFQDFTQSAPTCVANVINKTISILRMDICLLQIFHPPMSLNGVISL